MRVDRCVHATSHEGGNSVRPATPLLRCCLPFVAAFALGSCDSDRGSEAEISWPEELRSLSSVMHGVAWEEFGVAVASEEDAERVKRCAEEVQRRYTDFFVCEQLVLADRSGCPEMADTCALYLLTRARREETRQAVQAWRDELEKIDRRFVEKLLQYRRYQIVR